ncbi:unnamed protein product [Enterobius vermicularis]|uniref:ZP domain-containing protein n=1 Tax=Enterobius vermicularis TaxID=51028 RepID=A0A0N4UXS5_ENTVE|nr:unnamed protein product [Enterobius vermicularis]
MYWIKEKKKQANYFPGKPRIVCVDDGLEFEITTLFPFNGQIFAHDRKRIPEWVFFDRRKMRCYDMVGKDEECIYSFREATTAKVKLSYEECGIKSAGQQIGQTHYHIQIIVVFEQKDGVTSLQSYIAQCEQQKVHYQKSSVPRRIEEALEEFEIFTFHLSNICLQLLSPSIRNFHRYCFRLHLVPARLEQKAPVPECLMRILREEEHSHNHEATEVDVVDLGQPMRIEWRLVPESGKPPLSSIIFCFICLFLLNFTFLEKWIENAYGFHIRNCTVQDRISGEEYLVIDARGCSTDINIFGHPHYDTYHDVASVHWHAFKVPDDSQLNIRCSFEICSDIEDSKSGISSCESIPSPPYCPDVISSPTNSILSDLNKNSLRKRSTTENVERSPMHQDVHADICIGTRDDAYCNSVDFIKNRNKHLNSVTCSSRGMCNMAETQRVCISSIWLSICTGLSAWTLMIAVGVHVYCRWCRRKRKCSNNVVHTTAPHLP